MTENDVLDASERYCAAELEGDTAATDELLTDDFRAVGPFGFVVEKPRWLDRYRNAELKYEAIEWTLFWARSLPYVSGSGPRRTDGSRRPRRHRCALPSRRRPEVPT